MTVVLEVDLKTFKRFRKDNFGYYWTEDANKFILVKSDGGVIIKAIKLKEDPTKDLFFRTKLDTLAVYCKKIKGV